MIVTGALSLPMEVCSVHYLKVTFARVFFMFFQIYNTQPIRISEVCFVSFDIMYIIHKLRKFKIYCWHKKQMYRDMG